MRPGRIRAVLGVALVLATTLAACSSGERDTTAPPAGGEPWQLPMLMGNFSLNTAPIATIEDGQSATRLVDYVPMASLPATNLEVFTTHAYVPTSGSYVVTLANIRVTVRRTDGSATGNIYRADMSSFVQQSTVDGQLYSVFRLTGFTAAAPAITRSTFANVTFEFDAQYQTQAGSTARTRPMTLEVYKRQ